MHVNFSEPDLNDSPELLMGLHTELLDQLPELDTGDLYIDLDDLVIEKHGVITIRASRMRMFSRK